MARNPQKGPSVPTNEGLSKITDQLFKQLKPCLPMASLERIEKELQEIELGDHRLPLKTFSPFIGKELFPIKSEKALKTVLNEGVRRAISLIDSGDIRIGQQLHNDILVTAIQPFKPTAKPRVPVRRLFTYAPDSSTNDVKPRKSK